MNNRFIDIADNFDIDYLIAHSKLSCIGKEYFVEETKQYFEKGERKGFFEPITFLNILHKQLFFFLENVEKPHTIVNQLKSINVLTEEEKHVLFGFILKWFNAYPFEERFINIVYKELPKVQSALRLLEIEFRSFQEDTPEKTYCIRDSYTISPPKLIPKATDYKFNQNDLKGISYDYDWDFYYSEKFDLGAYHTFKIVDYFERGYRKGFIEPKAFMNLFYKTYKHIEDNINTLYKNIEFLKNLPINDELRHILLGFIIYRLPSGINSLTELHFIKIKEVFLEYELLTIEKIVFGYEPRFLQLLTNLANKTTIQEKLNYWEEIGIVFSDMYPQIGISFKKLFIPYCIYVKHFEQFINSTEYLKIVESYEVMKYFENSNLYKELQIKLTTDNKIDFIQSELEELYRFKKEVACLTISKIEQGVDKGDNVFEGLINLKKEYRALSNVISNFSGGKFEIERLKTINVEIQCREEQVEYLKITELKYYDKNLLTTDWSNTFELKNNVAVKAYIKHVLYKNLLETKLKELEQPPPATPILENNISAPKNKEAKRKIKPKNLNPIQQIILGNIANDIKNDVGITSAVMSASERNYKGKKTRFSKEIIWLWIRKIRIGELKDEKLAAYFKNHQI